MGAKYTPKIGSIDELLKSPKFNGRSYSERHADLKTCLKNFFKDEEIQTLLESNDWVSIFHLWSASYPDGANKVGWVDYLLADFLFYSKVDFWNHLTKNDWRILGSHYLEGLEWED